MYYTVIKHNGLLRTGGKCRKHELHVLSFLSQWNTRLYLLYDIEAMWQKKTMDYTFSVLCSDKTWVFDQSECVQGPTVVVYIYI